MQHYTWRLEGSDYRSDLLIWHGKELLKLSSLKKLNGLKHYMQDNLDDLEPEPEPAIEFNFRMYQKSKGEQEPIPGLKIKHDKEYKIECKPELSI